MNRIAILMGVGVFTLAGTTWAAVKGEEISYQAGDVTMNGYLAYDDSVQGPRPGVLVVHEWWGHNAYARKRADMLAELGYVALAVDMYGDGKQAEHPEDAGKFAGEVMSNIDTAKARFMAALDVLKQRAETNPDRMAAIGYCFGGGVVLHMARMGVPLGGVASFHGSLKTKMPAEPGKVNAKVLVLHGADDKFIPQEDIDAFKQEMENAGVDMKFFAYPGALHSFTNPEADEFAKKFGMPIAYNAEADQQSWEELKTFLQQIFAE